MPQQNGTGPKGPDKDGPMIEKPGKRPGFPGATRPGRGFGQGGGAGKRDGTGGGKGRGGGGRGGRRGQAR